MTFNPNVSSVQYKTISTADLEMVQGDDELWKLTSEIKNLNNGLFEPFDLTTIRRIDFTIRSRSGARIVLLEGSNNTYYRGTVTVSTITGTFIDGEGITWSGTETGTIDSIVDTAVTLSYASTQTLNTIIFTGDISGATALATEDLQIISTITSIITITSAIDGQYTVEPPYYLTRLVAIGLHDYDVQIITSTKKRRTVLKGSVRCVRDSSRS